MPKKSQNRDEIALARAKRIRDFLRQRRTEKPLSMTQLAELAGCDRGTIRNVESAKVHILEENLTNIFDALEVSAAERARHLFETAFEVGSTEMKLKTAILRAILYRELPAGNTSEDIRQRLDQYDNLEFRQLTFNLEQRDQVLSILLDEGYLVGSLQGILVPREQQNQIDLDVVREYEDQVHALATLAGLRAAKELPLVISEIERVLKIQSSLISEKDLFDTIEYAHLLLTRGDFWELRMTSVYIGMIKHVYQVSLSLLRLRETESFFKDFAEAIGKLFQEVLAQYQINTISGDNEAIQIESGSQGSRGTPLQDVLQRYFEGNEQLVMHNPLA